MLAPVGMKLIRTENIIYQIERMTERKAWGDK